MSEEPLSDDNACDDNGIIVQFFDLKDPMSRFKSLLEQLWNVSLSDYTIWLQGTQQLDEDKSLIQHGVEGEGKVQIKLQLKMTKDGIKMINIIDVLKPTEDTDDTEMENLNDTVDQFPSKSTDCVQWVESKDFNVERQRHRIPSDPEEWSIEHVEKWIIWAIRTFDLKDIDLDDWIITGNEVCQINMDEYKKKVPSDPDGHFWTHLQVLQKCGQVAVCRDQEKQDETSLESRVYYNNKLNYTSINLWKFLLDLLTDKAHYDIIRWVNDDGEFHMVRPDAVARLWGQKKQRTNMTYEKLSRALRYYYEGDMISKVSGRRFVYRFHCDIKEIIGYSPMELNKLITEDN